MLKKILKIGIWRLIFLVIMPVILYLSTYPYGFWGLFICIFWLSTIGYLFYMFFLDEALLIIPYLSNYIVYYFYIILDVLQIIYETLCYIYNIYGYVGFFKYILIILICIYWLFL